MPRAVGKKERKNKTTEAHSTSEVEAGRLGVQRQPGLHSETQRERERSTKMYEEGRGR
jgi:hypothetical protein